MRGNPSSLFVYALFLLLGCFFPGCSFDIEEQQTVDNQPPAIINLEVLTTSGSAEISWSTNEPASSTMEYGLTANCELVTLVNTNRTTEHNFLLFGLDDETTYYFRILCFDKEGNTSVHNLYSFKTRDSTSPGEVVGLTVTAGLGQNTLTWTNPGDKDFHGTMIRFSTVSYPENHEDGSLLTTRQSDPNTDESLVHTGLSEGSTYYYSLFTYDLTHNYSLGSYGYGTPTDTSPPVISNVSATAGTSTALITWTTSTNATSQVEYGLDESYGLITVEDPDLVTSHSVPLTGLAVGTEHHYRVLSRDGEDNSIVSNDNLFFTLVPPEDGIAPGPVTELAIVPWDNFLEVQWRCPDDVDVTGVLIRTSTEGYPVAPNDGTAGYEYACNPNQWRGVFINADKVKTSYISIFAHDSVPNYSTPVSGEGIPIWKSPEILDVQVDAKPFTATIDWATDEFASCILEWYACSNPAVSFSSSSPYRLKTHTRFLADLVPSTEYCFEITAVDTVGNVTTMSGYQFTTDVMPDDLTPPGPVTQVLVTPQEDGKGVNLQFRCPYDNDVEGVLIRRSHTDYPTSITDGSFGYSLPCTPGQYRGITMGSAGDETSYFAIFAYDEVPNFSTPAFGSGYVPPWQ